MAQTKQYDNITVQENEDGEILLILNPDQYVQIMDTIDDLKYELAVTKAKLAQAEEEIKKAYNEDNKKSVDISNVALSAAAIIAIIASLSK